MNKIPEISILMSVYNGEDYIDEAIESIINQTFLNWELIAINDCSTDGTAEILDRYAKLDSRIKVHTNENNLRLPASLNKALSLACGKYVARMDSDDICLPERLEMQYKFMEENPDTALSTCRFFTLKNGTYSSGGCGGRCDFESLKALLLVTNPILHPGVIAKADVMKKLGYSTDVTCTEDLELWTRFVYEGYKIKILPQYLMVYRLHDKQITKTTLERQHREVVGIQKTYYSKMLECMDNDTEEFYINGIYFREKNDVKKLVKFYRWAKAVNKKKKMFEDDTLAYAVFEILAEYKRSGISKKQLMYAMTAFNPLFLVKEITGRKKRGRLDVVKCINTAKKIGLKQVEGTSEFPVFQKNQ